MPSPDRPPLATIVKAESLGALAKMLVDPHTDGAVFACASLLVVSAKTPPGPARRYAIVRRGAHVDDLFVDLEDSTVEEVADALEVWDRGLFGRPGPILQWLLGVW